MPAPPAFSDLGKVAKGVLYGGSTPNGNKAYDQVATISTVATEGVSFAATVTRKADKVDPTIKATWKHKQYSLISTFLPSGKVTATGSWNGAAPGLNLALTGTLPDISTVKVVADYAVPHLTLKTTVGQFTGADEKKPTVEMAATTGYKDITLGASGSLNWERQQLSNWLLAAGYVARDFVVSGQLSDSQEATVTYAHMVSPTFSAAGEVTKNLDSEDTTISVGAAKVLQSGAAVKGRVDSKGILSVLYETVLQPGTKLAVTGQYNLLSQEANPKVGFALDVKGP